MATIKHLNDVIYVRIMHFLPTVQSILLFAASCRPALLAYRQEQAKILWEYLMDFFDINLYEAFVLIRAPVFDRNA